MAASVVKVEGEVSSETQKQICGLSFKDIDENELSVLSIRPLDAERAQRYNEKVKEYTLNAKNTYSVECKVKSEDGKGKSDESSKEEKIVHICKSKAAEITLECKVSMDDFSPSGLIEYTFNGKDWFLSEMCLQSYEYYKQSKFKNWKTMIEKPDCMAAFRRLLKMGLINRMFDHVAFPSPPNEEQDWVVKDKKGKDVVIPRPVSALRIWNADTRKFKDVSPLLTGAPSDAEKEKVWTKMLGEFRKKHGDEYIDNLLKESKEENNKDTSDNKDKEKDTK